MKKTILAVALVLLLDTTMTLAQEETPVPPAELPAEASQPVNVEVGEYVFEIDGNEPVVTCIDTVSADLEGRYFEGHVLVRGLDGKYDSVARIESRATAEFENKQPGDCVP